MSQEQGIEAEGLVKRFGRTTAVDGVTLKAARGRVLGVLGPNGAGKTTVIRILATLARPDQGRASVAGFDVVRRPDEVRRRIALSGQNTSVDDELTGRANLVLIGRLLDLPRTQARLRASELIARFGLDDAAGRPVAGYSGGMRRRLDLAASLVGHPEVVFLDEPSVGLDPGKRDELWQMIRDLVATGVTVLLTTQYLEEADALADAIAVVDRGRVVASGSSAELKQRVGGHTVAVRLHDPADAPAVAAVLTGVAGEAARRAGERDLTVPVGDTDTFYRIAARLRADDVRVTELGLRLPSLDDVFRALIGAPAERPPTTERAAS